MRPVATDDPVAPLSCLIVIEAVQKMAKRIDVLLGMEILGDQMHIILLC